jgi:hypothetical protein
MINRRQNVFAWIHGHTHFSTTYEIDGCQVVSYQRGYPHEKPYSRFQGGGVGIFLDEKGQARVEVPA